MESISVFDIFKIGVGPSSSHTMGPWRAAQRFVAHLTQLGCFDLVRRMRTDLFGSLAKTGRGHGTDVAVILGLTGEDPETCETAGLVERTTQIRRSGSIALGGRKPIVYVDGEDLAFHVLRALPFHANGLRFTATLADDRTIEKTYYSVGGGFVVEEGEQASGSHAAKLPHPIERGEELLAYCRDAGMTIPQIVLANERTWRSDDDIRRGLLRIWRTMQECVWRGVHTGGVLPGGLNVVRRAASLSRRLLGAAESERPSLDDWLARVRGSTRDFAAVTSWISTFALAVNEENAAFGRVVTAPTNGAAGVIPSVLMYYDCFCDGTDEGVIDFMLTAGEVGSIFKKGATISAAMGGCQAEIGVSSAMAAAGLTQVLGGSPEQALMAAEIAMEHHLGMTCDPIGGLVQIPCIERNSMGAMKAITAAKLAIQGDPTAAIVPFDSVVRTMWETAQDMQGKYKETAEGGLAVNVPVAIPEC